jgi:hypothetical protein
MIGAGIGLLATPLIAAGLVYGHVESFRALPQVTMDWITLAAFVGAVVVIGILAGSRLSPVASLLSGLAFTGFAAAALVRVGLGGDHRLWYDLVPGDYLKGYESLLHTWSLGIGCLLLVASIFPSRWRARPARSAPPPPPEEEEEAAPEPPPLPKRIPSRY